MRRGHGKIVEAARCRYRELITPGRVLLCATVFGAIAAAPPATAGLFDTYEIDVYKPDKVFAGTTIFGDADYQGRQAIVEVDMSGKVVWSYAVPDTLGPAQGMDVEWIPASDHILFTRVSGVYEVDRKGRIVWSFKGHASHDADRLPNGNTLMAWAWGADSSDPEVREVDPHGRVVWQWHAAEHLAGEKRILDMEGLTHTNSVIRLANGNTLVSLRNFYMLVEVAPSGEIVWRLRGLFTTPHDPEILPNGNILVNTRHPQVIKEIAPSGKVAWSHVPDQEDVQTVRYNHQLPNGNILFVERTKIIEITRAGEIVWQLRLKGVGYGGADSHRWLYKAERIPAGKRPAPAYAYAAPSETLAGSGETTLSLDEQIAVQAQRAVRAMLARMDADGDGRIARSEFNGRAPFEKLDSDGDGSISAEEATSFHATRLTHAGTPNRAGVRTPGNTVRPAGE
jgi:hypothetical protein